MTEKVARQQRMVRELEGLAKARRTLQEAGEEIKTIEDEFAATELGERRALAVALRKSGSEEAAEIRDRLEQLAFEEHLADGTLPKGVTVTQQEYLSYAEREAILYCASHYPEALSLKKRVFEQMARSCLPFVSGLDEVVHIQPEMGLRVASDLSAYLPSTDSWTGEPG